MSSVPGSKAGQPFNWKGKWGNCQVDVVSGRMACITHKLAKNPNAAFLRLTPCVLKRKQWSILQAQVPNQWYG